jgi:hypothetical protein
LGVGGGPVIVNCGLLEDILTGLRVPSAVNREP